MSSILRVLHALDGGNDPHELPELFVQLWILTNERNDISPGYFLLQVAHNILAVSPSWRFLYQGPQCRPISGRQCSEQLIWPEVGEIEVE